MSGDINSNKFKLHLKSSLHDAVKQCQVTFANKRELATTATPCVTSLLNAWEAILMHGLKRKTSLHMKTLNQAIGSLLGPDTRGHSFWPLVKHHISVEERSYLSQLRFIHTDMGRARAWLRLALNEHSLERHLFSTLNHVSLLREFYENDAFLLDVELNPMLTNFAAGVNSILFALDVDDEKLNHVISTAASSMASTPRSPATGSGTVFFPSSAPLPGLLNDTSRTLIAQEVMTETITDESQGYESTASRREMRNRGLNTVSLDDDTSRDVTPVSSLFRRNQVKSDSDSISVPSNFMNSREIRDVNIYNGGGGGIHGNLDPQTRSVISDELNGSTSSSFDMRSANSTSSNNALVSLDTPVDGNRTGLFFSTGDDGSITSANGGSSLLSGNDAVPRKADAFTVSELRAALLETIDRKDAIEVENMNLKQELESMTSKSLVLQDELAALKASMELKQENYQETMETLRSENELLKVQLKKYLSTVQLLSAQQREVETCHRPETSQCPEKGSSTSTELCTTNHISGGATPSPVSDNMLQEKLQQVSEMHSELLELNDHLTRRLITSEHQVAAFMQQMEAVCGPLSHLRPPWLVATNEDGIHTTGTRLTLNDKSKCYNISLWIPAAFMKGNGTSAHHVYQIYVRIYPPAMPNMNSIHPPREPSTSQPINTLNPPSSIYDTEEWIVYRRYAEFRDFHKWARSQVAATGQLDFPPKQILSRQQTSVVESRRHRLEVYLRHCLRLLLEDRWSRFQQTTAENLDSSRSRVSSISSTNQQAVPEIDCFLLTRRDLAKWIPFIADAPTLADAHRDRFHDAGSIYLGV